MVSFLVARGKKFCGNADLRDVCSLKLKPENLKCADLLQELDYLATSSLLSYNAYILWHDEYQEYYVKFIA